MVPSENIAAPLGFPDLNLSVSYADALRYAQVRLHMLNHGSLKPFCEQHDLVYTSVVSLKNNNLKREEPRLLQRVLRHLDVATEVVRNTPSSASPRFLFPTQEALTTFQSQLDSFNAGSSDVPEEQTSVPDKPQA